jgi:flagellar biosynthesis/type III secretory pathway M-ring protein FliF/YscJ
LPDPTDGGVIYETESSVNSAGSDLVATTLGKATKVLIIAAVVIVLLLIVFIAIRVVMKNRAEKRKTEEVIKLDGYNKNRVDEKGADEVNSFGGEDLPNELPEETREDN